MATDDRATSAAASAPSVLVLQPRPQSAGDEAAMMESQTIADEWASYCREVLSKHPNLTPDMTQTVRMVFYSGACAALTLVGTGTAPIAALREELREHAASIRPPLQ